MHYLDFYRKSGGQLILKKVKGLSERNNGSFVIGKLSSFLYHPGMFEPCGTMPEPRHMWARAEHKWREGDSLTPPYLH